MTQIKKIKVLRILPTLATGGTEKQCIEVLTEYSENPDNYQCRIDLATIYGPSEIHILKEPSGINRIDIGKPCSNAGLAAAAKELKRILSEYDCVHAMLWPSVWAVSMSGIKGVPFVASLHGSGMAKGPLGIKRVADGFHFRKANHVVFNSNDGMKLLAPSLGLIPEKTSVIINGKRLTKAADCEKKTLVCAARVEPPKRHDLLLDALAMLPEESRIPAVFIGRGTEKQSFIEGINARGLKCVECTGELPETAGYLASALVLALPSDNEGISNVILEAWMAGAAVIASKVSGVTELARDGQDALLVENNPQAWADALARLISNPELRSKLSAEGYRRATTEFSIESAAKKWDELYLRLAETKKGSS